MTNTNTASGAADKALAYLDDLSDDAAAHIFPSDLAKCMTSECVVEVCSVRAGNPNEKTVPLFSREQVVAALASAAAPAEQPDTAYAELPDAPTASDAMVDAYLKAQREAVEEADRFGRPNIGGLHTNTVREACRAGLNAALEADCASRGQAPAGAAVEMHKAKCPALIGDACSCERSDPAVDKAWAQFCAGIGDGPDAPYPGMIVAFERYYGQSFADKDWRDEAAVWAAAWKARDAQPTPTPQQDAGVLEDAARYRHIRDVPHSEEVRSVLIHQQNAVMDKVIDKDRAAMLERLIAARKQGANHD